MGGTRLLTGSRPTHLPTVATHLLQDVLYLREVLIYLREVLFYLRKVLIYLREVPFTYGRYSRTGGTHLVIEGTHFLFVRALLDELRTKFWDTRPAHGGLCCLFPRHDTRGLQFRFMGRTRCEVRAQHKSLRLFV